MPNILAHNYIAYSVLPDRLMPDFRLGNILPDFVGMYRDQSGQLVDLSNLPPAVRIGKHIHHRTDEIFKDQPETAKLTSSLSAHLESIGLDYRASRLAGHFLVDLMLDGSIYDDALVQGQFNQLSQYVLDQKTILHQNYFPVEFSSYVSGFFERNIPAYYKDPRKLARITTQRLANRATTRKSAFDQAISVELLPEVAQAIDIHSERVNVLGKKALQKTINIWKSL